MILPSALAVARNTGAWSADGGTGLGCADGLTSADGGDGDGFATNTRKTSDPWKVVSYWYAADIDNDLQSLVPMFSPTISLTEQAFIAATPWDLRGRPFSQALNMQPLSMARWRESPFHPKT